MENYNSSEIINIGTGEDITIKKLSEMIKFIVGFKGEIVFDTTKPDGVPRKLLDVSKIKSLGWEPKFSLEDGIRRTYEWYCNNFTSTSTLTSTSTSTSTSTLTLTLTLTSTSTSTSTSILLKRKRKLRE